MRRLSRLADWPLAAKMILPTILLGLAVLVLGVIGDEFVGSQLHLMRELAVDDLSTVITLSQVADDVQAANGGIYRLLTLRAAHVNGIDVAAEVDRLTARIEQARARLASLGTRMPASAPRQELAVLRSNLARYRDTIKVVGSMLEMDFPSAVALVRPFDANAHQTIAELTGLADNVARSARDQVADSSALIDKLNRICAVLMIAVLLAAGAIASEITRRTAASVRRIAQATLLVANGDQALRVETLARRDELGAIVESLRSFQSNNARINFLAHHDALTALPNRALFHDRVSLAVQLCAAGRHCALHCLDLDHFKAVNDTLGHPVGDALLREVASRLISCVREGDTVARLGGDEFAIVQLGVTDPQQAGALAERVIEVISEPYEINGHQLMVGTSVGVVTTPCTDLTVDGLMRNADMALYRAKAEGRGTWRFFEPDMDAAQQQRRVMEMDMRAALAQHQFELYYQPLVNVATHEVSGFEALIRWHHPERGMISPAQFIPLAEETGLIVQMGAWVMRQACADAATWQGGLKVAVNLSPLQFKDRNLLNVVQQALTASGLPAWRLELEITEGVLLHENEATLAILHKLRALGIRISMDDFGTGYSSLSYLRSFPFDKIKIDQSFIRDLSAQSGAVAIVRAVTGLGSSLGIRTTAEGVETEDQLARLISEGCTEVQGYLFSPPRPAKDVPRLVAEIGKRPASGLVPVVVDSPAEDAPAS